MYKFEKIKEDTYKLITKEREFTFTRTVDLAKEIQKVDLYTTSYLADMLAERGETFENTKLKVVIQKGNETIIDESNFNALKEKARNLAYFDVLNKVFNKLFGIGYIDLLKTIEVEKDEDVHKFVTELTRVITRGIEEDTPRGENKE